ncbi:M20/M25/M40 family metallo-hydrolase [Arenibaculum pallidiluteum]|uniref:M20/M25/M40 family metallo-hydrolase n=1 Tax=Arenibaculum pallidiluteum TaxID=2812559 RepID=UPI001A97A539|nr:M20/M25/M40 family metallo-hydrolase [Arenibaculum pallidiluteum]
MTADAVPPAARWAIALTEIPSVTGTPDEAGFADRLAAMLRASPAFAGRAGDVWTLPVPGVPEGRACVCALLRGSGPRTVVLTGHFDTVHVEDYGDLAPLACRPHELKPALAARLAASATTDAERRALGDLAGPDFLPGRGLLDMKSGLAAGIAVLEEAARDPARQGNLLFLAVPDEEVNSAGARAAAPALAGIASRLGLEIAAAINLDALVDDGDGTIGRAVALGTIGKLLPSALVVGRAVHASDAYRGLGAGAIAGALAADLEWAPELSERTEDEVTAGFSLLGMKDGKRGYDVTTPERVWMFWNLMVQDRGPEEIMSILERLAGASVAGLVDRLGARSAAALGAQAAEQAGAPLPVAVMTYADLRRRAEARVPGAAGILAEAAADAVSRGLDLPEQCRVLTERTWDLSGLSGPAVVLGFASMPYLPTRLLGEDGRRLEAAAREAAAEVAGRRGTSIRTLRYFPGISDMSFLGQADEGAIAAVAGNTPAWGAGIPWPEGPALGGVPIVNAGPWGRDYHTPLERLHAPYAFEVLPELVGGIARRVLAAD